jgi:ADP-ribosylglycohydrolase
MIGVIAGDIIGSIYEQYNIKTKDFPLFTDLNRFTDDSVLTIATIDKILNRKTYQNVYKDYGLKYPDAGYGKMFIEWTKSEHQTPYGSWGNGSAMRVCPVGSLFNHGSLVMNEAADSSIVTHSHPEAIRAAQCVAMAVFMARNGAQKSDIFDVVQNKFEYDLTFDLMELKETYVHDVSAKGTLPVAIKSFLDSTDFEDAIRLAISIGGDSDTIAAIVGGISEEFYGGVPDHIAGEVMNRIPDEFKTILSQFYSGQFL